MGIQHLGDLLADANHGMERSRRVLKNHSHLASAHRTHLGFIEPNEIDAVEPGATRQRGVAQQPHQRESGRRLAASAFANQAERFTFLDAKRNAVHGPGVRKGDRKVLDLQQRRRGDFHQSRTFGSSASRNPSPMKLKQATASVIAIPGKIASQGST